MDIFRIEFDSWNNIVIHINWIAIIISIFMFFAIQYLVKFVGKKLCIKSMQIDQSTIGLGNTTVTVSYNYKDIEIAYKVWVELSTRKIGIPIELEKDVIVEVYKSWYKSFEIIRELLKDIPANKLNGCSELVGLISQVLNDGLRKHLTNWQAEFKSWYGKEIEERKGEKPQDIQKDFPRYKELSEDLIKTNNELIQFTKYMKKIAFKEDE